MHIAIVGAGIAGLASAWALTKGGHRVTLFEQGPIPNPLAASGDHHRIIRRAYPAASGYGRAITEAYEAWNVLWADLGARHLDPRGFLCASREPGDEAERLREGLEAGGFPFELLGPEEAVARWPFLVREGLRYAFASPEGGALHCRRIAADLGRWLVQHGARLRTETRVAAVDPDRGTVKTVTGDTLSADAILVTAGAWAPKLFPELRADLTPYRTAVVYLDPPADLAAAWAAAPTILDVGGATDGYIIPPSGDGGLKFGSGLHKQRHDDADRDRAARPGEGEAVRDLFAGAIARVGEYRVRATVSCAYTFTEDERFFATRIGRAWIVSACSGHGYKFGAAVGQRVAAALAAGDLAGLQRWLRAE